MNTKFMVNDYVLIWSLLFQASISENILNLKKKLWENYKDKYNNAYGDKALIVKDYKNFIPNDDTVYNYMLENKYYEKIKKQVEKYRLEVMKLWDKNKKETNDLIKNVLRKDLPEQIFFIINKETNSIEYIDNTFIIGKTIDRDNPEELLYDICQLIFEKNIKDYNDEDRLFKNAIIEFAVINEYATKLDGGKSHYFFGRPELLSLKRWLYPYWLMYLGIPKTEFKDCMARDNVYFDETKYAYEKELKKMNIEEFIDFCIRNKRYMIREGKM